MQNIPYPSEVRQAAIDRAVRAFLTSKTVGQVATAERYAVLVTNRTMPAEVIPATLVLFDELADRSRRRVRRAR